MSLPFAPWSFAQYAQVIRRFLDPVRTARNNGLRRPRQPLRLHRFTAWSGRPRKTSERRRRRGTGSFLLSVIGPPATRLADVLDLSGRQTRHFPMSALGHVWTAPSWQGFSSRMQHWSVQPCVRPVSAVHVTAGHNALRGSGPGQNLAFDNALAHVGCPDRRIDRLCITCCSPLPNHHITPRARRDLVHAASATGSLYRSPLAMIAQAILAILFASAMAATLVGRRANKAVSHGRCLVPWILA